jgi:hypothetical protein
MKMIGFGGRGEMIKCNREGQHWIKIANGNHKNEKWNTEYE